jgi:hypothetical protein
MGSVDLDSLLDFLCPSNMSAHRNLVQLTLTHIFTTITAGDSLLRHCHIDMIWPDLTKLYPEYHRLAAVHVKNMSGALTLDLWLTSNVEPAWNFPWRYQLLFTLDALVVYRFIFLLWGSCIACALSGHLIENCISRLTQHSLRVHATWHDLEQGVTLSDH